ncbi:hypothetical protein F4558_005232 [Micromonospora profundi]|nr:hypothetical protein [Micromonospora profundi]
MWPEVTSRQAAATYGGTALRRAVVHRPPPALVGPRTLRSTQSPASRGRARSTGRALGRREPAATSSPPLRGRRRIRQSAAPPKLSSLPSGS